MEKFLTEQLSRIVNVGELEHFRVHALGSTGIIKNLMGFVACANEVERRGAAEQLNVARERIENAFEQKKSSLQ